MSELVLTVLAETAVVAAMSELVELEPTVALVLTVLATREFATAMSELVELDRTVVLVLALALVLTVLAETAVVAAPM